MIVIGGAADEPVWIEIGEDDVIFRNAEHLWGLDTYDTEDRVKSQLTDGRAGVVCIGPAGENGVRFAVIENDRLAQRRTNRGGRRDGVQKDQGHRLSWISQKTGCAAGSAAIVHPGHGPQTEE